MRNGNESRVLYLQFIKKHPHHQRYVKNAAQCLSCESRQADQTANAALMDVKIICCSSPRDPSPWDRRYHPH